MVEEKREQVWPLTPVAIVAPVWLQHALVVFLHSVPELKLVACTATVRVLLSLDLELIPNLIILETDKRYQQAQEQIRRLRSAWPASHIVALVPRGSLKALVQAAGADMALDSGIVPEELRQAIIRLVDSDQEASTNCLGES
jgi:hypothetical protein